MFFSSRFLLFLLSFNCFISSYAAKPKVIIVSGVSSAGKSTIVRDFLEPFVKNKNFAFAKFGIDNVIYNPIPELRGKVLGVSEVLLPKDVSLVDFVPNENVGRAYDLDSFYCVYENVGLCAMNEDGSWTRDSLTGPCCFKAGKVGKAVWANQANKALNYLRSGLDKVAIFDEVLTDKDVVDFYCKKFFKGADVFLIQVKSDPAISEKLRFHRSQQPAPHWRPFRLALGQFDAVEEAEKKLFHSCESITVFDLDYKYDLNFRGRTKLEKMLSTFLKK